MPVQEGTPVLPLANHDAADWPPTAQPVFTSTPRRRWLKAVEWSGQLIPLLPKAILGLLIVLVGSLVLWASMKAVFDGKATIEPVAVSKEWENRGVAGAVISRRILDEVSRINKVAKTSKQRAQVGGGQGDVLANIQVPQTSLSVQVIVTILRDLFGRDETRISGELTGDPGWPISLVIRTERQAGRHVERFAGADLDVLIRQAAAEVLKRIDPYVLASYYYEKKQFKEMDETIDDILASPDPSARAWALNLRGINLDRQNRNEEANAYYDRAIQLDGRLANALLNKGNLAARRGDVDTAIALYRKAHEAEPNYYLPLSNWGATLMDLGEYDEALIRLQQAVHVDPTQIRPYTPLGILLERMEELEQAAIVFERAYEMSPDNLDTLVRLGTILYRLGQSARADARFRAALKHLLNVDVYNAWGNALLAANKTDAARQRFREARDAGPWDTYAQLQIGRSWLKENEINLAEASCRDAMETDDTSSAVHAYCGYVLISRGDERAVQYFKRAFALAPDDAGILVALGWHYYSTGNADQGFESFQKAVSISPTDSEIYQAWAFWRLNDQDYNGALEMYDRSIRLYPANESAYEGRVLVLQCLGDMQQAKQSESKAKAIYNRKLALLDRRDRSASSMIERSSRLGILVSP